MNSYNTAPSSGLNVTEYITPAAARILVDAYDALQKLGLKPFLNVNLQPIPEPVVEKVAETSYKPLIPDELEARPERTTMRRM